jgi:signal transduction histidine kinase
MQRPRHGAVFPGGAAAAAWRRSAPAAAPVLVRGDNVFDKAPAETTGDPQLLERMVSNLVNNAVRHNQPGGCWIAAGLGRRECGPVCHC